MKENKNALNSEYEINDSIEKVIVELKRRAQQKRLDANRFFYTIVFVIAIGLTIFIFAYRFTSNVEIDNAIDTAHSNLVSELKKVSVKYDSIDIKSQMLNFIDSTNEDPRRFIFKEAKREFNKSFSFTLIKYMPDSLRNSSPFYYNEYFDAMFKAATNNRRTIDTLAERYYDNLEKNLLIGLKASNYESYNLVNIIATRFGSVIILLFLVQILLRVFRYNTRLANFYSARANALEIYLKSGNKTSELPLELLAAMLSPDSIDMGLQKNPTDQFLEIMKLYTKR